MNSSTGMQATGLVIALGSITGVSPVIQEYADHYSIFWKAEDRKKVTAFLDNSIDKMTSDKKVNPIQIDLLPVVYPIVLKRVAPYVVLSAIGLVALGMILER